jgi:hypothetical protein
MLIAAAVQQLNKNPAPLKEWHILKKEYVGPAEFEAHLRKKNPDELLGVNSRTYLVAVIDSDQGRKIIAIAGVLSVDGIHDDNGAHWARMYNCDAVFSSPQEGGTPLIR